MPSTCIACGIEADALRNPARILAGRVVTLCRRCAGLPPATLGLKTVPCSFCADDVEAWRAPAVVVDGVLMFRCPACSAVPTGVPRPGRDLDELEVELSIEPSSSEPPARPHHWRVVAVGAAVAAAASLYAWVGR